MSEEPDNNMYNFLLLPSRLIILNLTLHLPSKRLSVLSSLKYYSGESRATVLCWLSRLPRRPVEVPPSKSAQGKAVYYVSSFTLVHKPGTWVIPVTHLPTCTVLVGWMLYVLRNTPPVACWLVLRHLFFFHNVAALLQSLLLPSREWQEI